MKFIKSHKKSMIIAGACLILVILAIFAIYRMLYPNSSKSVYGSRLEGAPAIDEAVISKIKEGIDSKGLTNSIEYSLSGKKMKFFIDVKVGTAADKAQELTIVITDNLSSTILNFYDIEVYITDKANDASKDYPMIGYHAKGADKFSFTMNKEEVGE